MKPPVEVVRLSPVARQQLIQLKRHTKIEQWNILCRWGFCCSLAETTIPSPVPIPTENGIEIEWNTFAGKLSDILIIALKQRCHNDGLGTDKETLQNQFRLHLHRGIAYLAGNPHIRKIDNLVSLATKE